MKIEVNQLKTGKYQLKIEDELILTHERLGMIMTKIEKYLKIRFLLEEDKNMMEKLGGLFQ